MKVQITYSEKQLRRAAKLVLKKNPQILQWPNFFGYNEVTVEDVVSVIRQNVIDGAYRRKRHLLADGLTTSELWSAWEATGGYVLIFSADWHESTKIWEIEVEILVDPTMCLGGRTVTVDISEK